MSSPAASYGQSFWARTLACLGSAGTLAHIPIIILHSHPVTQDDPVTQSLLILHSHPGQTENNNRSTGSLLYFSFISFSRFRKFRWLWLDPCLLFYLANFVHLSMYSKKLYRALNCMCSIDRSSVMGLFTPAASLYWWKSRRAFQTVPRSFTPTVCLSVSPNYAVIEFPYGKKYYCTSHEQGRQNSPSNPRLTY